MERTYIQMPILANNPIYSFNDLRTRFFELTGMKIPSGTIVNVQETHYLTGELKTHLTPDIEDILKAEFPMVSFSNGWPVGWVTKVESE